METSIPGFLYERLPEQDPPPKTAPSKEVRPVDPKQKPHSEEDKA